MGEFEVAAGVLWAILAKHEAESPLFVDADAVLALTISCERLEAVARWYPQIFQAHRRIELLQFRERAFSNVRRMGTDRQLCECGGSLLVLERLDRHSQ